ncbi:hypothetical protein B296_00036907 [Ensete ventricosum]|uniref:Uncharacterized protein n=1 Tax=Ensete ventricosum TaxID=4639 RepID=A0A426Y8T4_ENSVE|nr:hypothetical protein B296_00036907 [Ensete ventricosum]
MTSRIVQGKPPVPPRSPSNKEILDEAPLDKRHRFGVMGTMVGPATNPRTTRPVLSSVNGGPNSGDQAAAGSDGGSASGIEFSSREDVERLLAEKMKGKTKNDFKVKSLWYFFPSDVVIKSCENERETRVAVEKSRDALSLDLQRVNRENKCLSDQVPYTMGLNKAVPLRADLTTIKTMTEYEEQKKTTIDLQDRLAEAELQIIEAEKLRKKLHNTILVTTLLCLTNIS